MCSSSSTWSRISALSFTEEETRHSSEDRNPGPSCSHWNNVNLTLSLLQHLKQLSVSGFSLFVLHLQRWADEHTASTHSEQEKKQKTVLKILESRSQCPSAHWLFGGYTHAPGGHFRNPTRPTQPAHFKLQPTWTFEDELHSRSTTSRESDAGHKGQQERAHDTNTQQGTERNTLDLPLCNGLLQLLNLLVFLLQLILQLLCTGVLTGEMKVKLFMSRLNTQHRVRVLPSAPSPALVLWRCWPLDPGCW